MNKRIDPELLSQTTHAIDSDPAEQEAMFYLEASAKPITPPGFEYIGGYTVHVYGNQLVEQFEFKALTNLKRTFGSDGKITSGLTETLAIQSVEKVLRPLLMSLYRGKKG